jgi:hypothetical protein
MAAIWPPERGKSRKMKHNPSLSGGLAGLRGRMARVRTNLEMGAGEGWPVFGQATPFLETLELRVVGTGVACIGQATLFFTVGNRR